MKVFNGKKFLEAKQVKIELSNGVESTVQEISQEKMDAFSKLGENSSGSEVKIIAADILNLTPEQLNGIGMVELRGALDFLFESLFMSK